MSLQMCVDVGGYVVMTVHCTPSGFPAAKVIHLADICKCFLVFNIKLTYWLFFGLKC